MLKHIDKIKLFGILGAFTMGAQSWLSGDKATALGIIFAAISSATLTKPAA